MNYLRFIVLFYSGNPNAPQIRSTAPSGPVLAPPLARWAWPRPRPVRGRAENSGQTIAVELGHVRRHAARTFTRPAVGYRGVAARGRPAASTCRLQGKGTPVA